MVMMCMTLTVWGILAVQLLHPINKELTKRGVYADCDRCPLAFATVFDSLLTFWKQLVAGDNWGEVCEPIIMEEKWTFIFFILVLVTVSLTMLNCILAVVVEAGAAAAAADEHDKALEREKMVVKAEGKLIDLCQGLDADNSGSLNCEEFLNGYHNNKSFRECLEVMHVTESDMFMIFNICDEDDSGDVDYREFVEQLRRIKHSGEQMLLHYVTDIRHMVNKIRPECLKPPVKKEGEDLDNAGGQPENLGKEPERKLESSANEGQCPPASGTVEVEEKRELPPFLAEVLGVDDALDSQKMNADKLEDQGADLEEGLKNDDKPNITSAGAVNIEERLEHISQINADLVTIMSDVAQQSKAQTSLLNTIVIGVQSGAGRNGAVNVNVMQPTGGANSMPWDSSSVSIEPVDPPATPGILQLAVANGESKNPCRDGLSTLPGCCVRVV